MYNEIMEESNPEVLFLKNGNTFTGGLFFRLDPWEIVEDVLEEVTVNDTDEESEVLKVIQTAIEMKRRHNIKVFDDSERTMKHWQYVNGFSEIIFL